MDSFRAERVSTIRICYDGSLAGLGIILWEYLAVEEEWVEIGHAGLMTNYPNSEDSSYQNTMEFTAVTLALVMLVQRGKAHRCIDLVGDSVASLKWSMSGRVKSTFAMQSALLFALLGTNFGFEIIKTEHIPGTTNIACDQLSRAQLSGDSKFDSDTITLTDNPVLVEAVELVNPFSRICSTTEFDNFWLRASEFIQRLTLLYT
jgi:ribonuclease HI